MTQWNIDRGKKITGGKINTNRKKKKYQRGSQPIFTTIGNMKKRIEKRRFGLKKIRIINADFVNVINPKTKKAKKLKIIDILEHEDNIHYTRRGIITKGCVVKTEAGIVKITSRPSQHGVVNGILLEENIVH